MISLSRNGRMARWLARWGVHVYPSTLCELIGEAVIWPLFAISIILLLIGFAIMLIVVFSAMVLLLGSKVPYLAGPFVGVLIAEIIRQKRGGTITVPTSVATAGEVIKAFKRRTCPLVYWRD